jgi:hypothetical protein
MQIKEQTARYHLTRLLVTRRIAFGVENDYRTIKVVELAK